MAQSAIAAAVRTVRAGKKFVPRRAAVVLTQSAVNEVKSILADNSEAVGLRIGVRTRGCNGKEHMMEYVKEKDQHDEEVVQDGVRIFIDKKAQLTLLGTEIDYKETKLGREFVFNNPNAKGTCGCGQSFHI